MARSSTIEGPFLKTCDINGVVKDSTVRSLVVYKTTSSTKRTRPKNLIRNPTPLLARTDVSKRAMTYTYRADGRTTYGPSTTQASYHTAANAAMAASEREAITRLLTKVKGEVWNLSTFMGELPETWGWFKNTAKSVLDSYLAVKRGRFSDVARIVARGQRRYTTRRRRPLVVSTTGLVADRWLEWRYAIMPLMYDMDDALKYLYDARVKAYLRREAGGSAGKYLGANRGTLIQSAEWHCRACMYYEVNPYAEAFKKLGLLNPVATLWELTPLSFVADWFFPIGTYLANLDAMAGVTPVSRTLSTRATVRESRRQGGLLPSQDADWSEFERREYSRATTYSLSPPLPTFGLSLSAKQLADSCALFRNIALRG